MPSKPLLSGDAISFFTNHGFGIVTTVGRDGIPHHACKGIVEIDSKGYVYLIDLYHGRTYRNLVSNNTMTLTAVDEHSFKGYSLIGAARPDRGSALARRMIKQWEPKLNHRLIRRIIRNIHDDKNESGHPEALLPGPRYVIVMKVKGILDLSPPHAPATDA